MLHNPEINDDTIIWWQWYWWQLYVGDFMGMTVYGWWQNHCVYMTYLIQKCWWQNWDVFEMFEIMSYLSEQVASAFWTTQFANKKLYKLQNDYLQCKFWCILVPPLANIYLLQIIKMIWHSRLNCTASRASDD